MTWRELALNRGPFRRLWLGDAVSLFGDWFSYVAVGVLALGSDASGGELLAVAVVLVAHSLPLAVLAPLAGRFADRYDRRAIMVGASLLRGLAVLGMITAALA
ncbi:MAG: MFS transporter, partial [Nannocystaceae bacterium]